MSKPLRITIDGSDLDCLMANLGHPDAPTLRYGVLPPFTLPRKRTVMQRRYGLWVYEAQASQDACTAILAARDGNEDAVALKLTEGEYFGLEVNLWRNRHELTSRGLLPLSNRDTLDLLALYKRSLATQAKRRDEAAAIEEARKAIRSKYEPERVLIARIAQAATVH